jgi:hypothetical protein
MKAAVRANRLVRPAQAPLVAERTHARVRRTPEVTRILELPRHRWQEYDLDALVETVTGAYRLPGGTMRLRPVQAMALKHLFESDGLFGSIAVGEGKTLISFLAPVVVDSKCALLLVPAKLKEKTRRDFAELRKHWEAPRKIEVMSYELLGRAQAAEVLDKLKPDLIIADECHRLKNLSAAVTRRVIRYLQAHPAVRVAVMSGTVTSRSLKDFHHLIAAALRGDMPLPKTQSETQMWARAIDEKVEVRARPGALIQFLPHGSQTTLETIRAAVGRRIYETPGVVHTDKSSVSASILIDYFDPKIPQEVTDHLETLIRDKIAPNGDDCMPSDVYRHTRTLVQGFYYEWDPEPPEDWRKARSSWGRFVRRILEDFDPKYDSELTIANACSRRRHRAWVEPENPEFNHDGDPILVLFECDGCSKCEDGWIPPKLSTKAYDAWKAVRKKYEINSIPRWLTDTTLVQALKKVGWHGGKFNDPVMIWIEHQAPGEKLVELTGLSYYHRQGKDQHGNAIEDADPNESMILSIASNNEGRNLQAWNRSLVIPPPGSGKTWEQLLGRQHRPGQLADQVEVLVMLGHARVSEAMSQAFSDARYIQQTTLNPQKLLLADSTREY